MTLAPALTLARARALQQVDNNGDSQPLTLPLTHPQPYPPTLPPNPTPQPYPPTPPLHQCAAEVGAALLSLATSTEAAQHYVGTEAGGVLLVDR